MKFQSVYDIMSCVLVFLILFSQEVIKMANEKKQDKKTDKKTLWTRVMCLFLAFMMVVGIFWTVLEALL